MPMTLFGNGGRSEGKIPTSFYHLHVNQACYAEDGIEVYSSYRSEKPKAEVTATRGR